MSFHGKTAIITGALRNIGLATAQAFFADGANVVLMDIDEAVMGLAGEFGERGLVMTCDVTQESQVITLVEAAERRFGGVDILVNNAALLHSATVTKTPEADWDRVMAVNVKGPFLCAKHAIPSMQKRGGGVVVNISSAQAFVSLPGCGAYIASKSALLGLTRSIAIDYAPAVRCVAVCPGAVETEQFHDFAAKSPDAEAARRRSAAMHPMNRLVTPDEVADLVLFLSSEKAGFMTGHAYRIDGGMGTNVLQPLA